MKANVTRREGVDPRRSMRSSVAKPKRLEEVSRVAGRRGTEIVSSSGTAGVKMEKPGEERSLSRREGPHERGGTGRGKDGETGTKHRRAQNDARARDQKGGKKKTAFVIRIPKQVDRGGESGNAQKRPLTDRGNIKGNWLRTTRRNSSGRNPRGEGD